MNKDYPILNNDQLKKFYKNHQNSTCFCLDKNGLIKQVKHFDYIIWEYDQPTKGKSFLDFIVLKEERKIISDIIHHRNYDEYNSLQITLKNSSELGNSIYSVFIEFFEEDINIHIFPIIVNTTYDEERILREKLYNMLFTMTEKMHSSKNLKEIINLILGNIANVLKFETVVMFLKEKEKNVYINKYAYGRDNVMNYLNTISIDIDKIDKDGIFYNTVTKKESMFIKNILDPENEIIMDEAIMPILESRSILTIPLLNSEKDCIGIIAVDREKKTFEISNTQRNLLVFFCNQAAIALSNFEFLKMQQDYAKNLKKEVSRQTSKLRKAYEELKELDKMKDDFISIASHELRTPMSVIKGYVSLFLEGSLGDIPKKQINFLEKIFNNTNRLINLVNDMLDLNKLEAGKMDINKQDIVVKDFIYEIIHDFEKMYKEKNITLSCQKCREHGFVVFADRNKIKQVFTNLLSNSFKFTPSGGKVKISVKEYSKSKKFIEFIVEDSGIGIPEDQIDKIFKKFAQIDNYLQRESEGTGLGLAIVKEIIKRHKGKIWVKSILQKGTSFHLTLPKNI